MAVRSQEISNELLQDFLPALVQTITESLEDVETMDRVLPKDWELMGVTEQESKPVPNKGRRP
jgi:hypothetical protein